MSTRFAAVIKIVKVTEHAGTGRGDDKSFDTELANIVVRNTDLEKLLDKVQGHLLLVEE